jgi:hypothetical protein
MPAACMVGRFDYGCVDITGDCAALMRTKDENHYIMGTTDVEVLVPSDGTASKHARTLTHK